MGRPASFDLSRVEKSIGRFTSRHSPTGPTTNMEWSFNMDGPSPNPTLAISYSQFVLQPVLNE